MLYCWLGSLSAVWWSVVCSALSKNLADMYSVGMIGLIMVVADMSVAFCV
jgi:hypothetical protein